MGLPVSTHCSKLMASRSLAALMAASTLAGCAVGPVYKRPDVTPVAEFRSQVGPIGGDLDRGLAMVEHFQR